ncbi:MAG: type II toxin-antitoxin system HicA family toxin [Candidatus Binataceae bacterium]|jgi:predicted RNA binding protein YcfA (HicA-like mRNA interferase family)
MATENLLERARTNPAGLSFSDFEKLLKEKGWLFKRQKGSHRLWYSPAGFRLPIQGRGNNAKTYQVRQFLAQYDREYASGKSKR